MKKKHGFWLALLVLAALATTVPWKQVVFYNIELQDQTGTPLKRDATGTFLDASGKTVATIPAKPFVLGVYSIQWWTTDDDFPQRFMTPEIALSAKEVVIKAKGCDARRLRVEPKRERQGLSLSPHGGGPPFDYVTFEPVVKLDCTEWPPSLR
jgi:hypothetical protein